MTNQREEDADWSYLSHLNMKSHTALNESPPRMPNLANRDPASCEHRQCWTHLQRSDCHRQRVTEASQTSNRPSIATTPPHLQFHFVCQQHGEQRLTRGRSCSVGQCRQQHLTLLGRHDLFGSVGREHLCIDLSLILGAG